MDDTVICEWFALCVNPTEEGVTHPILGVVPICTRCAGKMGATPTHTVRLVKGTIESEAF